LISNSNLLKRNLKAFSIFPSAAQLASGPTGVRSPWGPPPSHRLPTDNHAAACGSCCAEHRCCLPAEGLSPTCLPSALSRQTHRLSPPCFLSSQFLIRTETAAINGCSPSCRRTATSQPLCPYKRESHLTHSPCNHLPHPALPPRASKRHAPNEFCRHHSAPSLASL
jgi:hypothetical protein